MADQRKNLTVKILEHTYIHPSYRKLVVESAYLARVSCPGQFCMFSLPSVFLKRPISIYHAGKNRVEFLYKVVGAGTERLSRYAPGDTIDILGPLGNGFNAQAVHKGFFPVFVAGGIGIASLHFLATTLGRPGILFYGAESKADLVGLEEFKKLKWQVKVSTMDGSHGFKGYVTALCGAQLTDTLCKQAVLFSCGPKAMLKNTARVAQEHGLSGFASLEEMMACGVGICQGCAIQINGEYKKVCDDGPVFDLRSINWE